MDGDGYRGGNGGPPGDVSGPKKHKSDTAAAPGIDPSLLAASLTMLSSTLNEEAQQQAAPQAAPAVSVASHVPDMSARPLENIEVEEAAYMEQPQLLFVDPSQLPPGTDNSQFPLYYLVRTPGTDGLLTSYNMLVDGDMMLI